MSYGTNSPFGLKVYGHQIGGTDDIKVNSNYTISANSISLNKGDPVMYVPQSAQYGIVNGGYQGKQAEIMLYNPLVALAAAGNATTVVAQNGIQSQAIVGVFQGCEYYTPNGTYVAQEYWTQGTPTNGAPVIASIIDDPYVIFDIQLGTFMGSDSANPTRFLLLPCMQIQNAQWPLTGTAGANATVANSAIIGSNLSLATGRGSTAGAGSSGSLSTITLNGTVMNYRDNPTVANQGTPSGNPWGTSTFYACPSIAATNANPSVTDGRNEYNRGGLVSGDLRVLGFTPEPRNIPGKFGQPGVGVAGNYFNTPFLNVLVTINKHVNKQGTTGVVVA